MEAFKTHGAFSWSELLTSDPKSATEFYGKLFGWKFDAMDMGPNGTYHVIKIGDAGIGGIMKTPPGAAEAGLPPTWGSYVTVDNVDETVKQCSTLGGKVMMPPTDIPNVGRFAVIQDLQGAWINVITYAPK